MVSAKLSAERQRLFTEHGLHHNLARQRGVKPMGGDHVPAIGDDSIRVLHNLQPLEMIFVMQAHALPDDVEDVDDLEWPVALIDRKSTRLNSSHSSISYAVFCLKK